MQIGDKVRVLSPFDETYKDIYAISDIIVTEDAKQVYLIDNTAFDEIYLEIVE